jgi:hypothetical protein
MINGVVAFVNLGTCHYTTSTDNRPTQNQTANSQLLRKKLHRKNRAKAAPLCFFLLVSLILLRSEIFWLDFFYSSCVLSRRSRTMAIFSSAHLALRRSLAVAPRAASLGESLQQASDGYFARRLLHGQLLPRCFTSDAFGPNKVFLPHPTLHQFQLRCVRLIKPRARFKCLFLL